MDVDRIALHGGGAERANGARERLLSDARRGRREELENECTHSGSGAGTGDPRRLPQL
jgi:hypothetical protein